jgi:hypothetical protein
MTHYEVMDVDIYDEQKDKSKVNATTTRSLDTFLRNVLRRKMKNETTLLAATSSDYAPTLLSVEVPRLMEK